MEKFQGGGKGRFPSSPFIIEPSTHHTHSLILLHGLGSTGEKFGKEFIETGVCGSGKRLTEIFPGARFIFPTSKRRRSSAFGRTMLTQWFDIASLEDPLCRNYTQVEGLEESYHEVLDLINQESQNVAPSNIIIGGLSQGCAMALICLLAVDFPVGGFVGMSGWLPFSNDINRLAKMEDDTSDGDPFSSDPESASSASGDHKHQPQDPVAKILGFVRDLLTLTNPEGLSNASSAISTPVFLGHGDADEKIRFCLGENARCVMESVGFHVEWKCYKDHGHWYKIPEQIDDIVEFLHTKAGWALGE